MHHKVNHAPEVPCVYIAGKLSTGKVIDNKQLADCVRTYLDAHAVQRFFHELRLS